MVNKVVLTPEGQTTLRGVDITAIPVTASAPTDKILALTSGNEVKTILFSSLELGVADDSITEAKLSPDVLALIRAAGGEADDDSITEAKLSPEIRTMLGLIGTPDDASVTRAKLAQDVVELIESQSSGGVALTDEQEHELQLLGGVINKTNDLVINNNIAFLPTDDDSVVYLLRNSPSDLDDLLTNDELTTFTSHQTVPQRRIVFLRIPIAENINDYRITLTPGQGDALHIDAAHFYQSYERAGYRYYHYTSSTASTGFGQYLFPRGYELSIEKQQVTGPATRYLGDISAATGLTMGQIPQALRDAVNANTAKVGVTDEISSVASDATLTGDGTSGDPLKVAIPYTQAEKTKLEGLGGGSETTPTASGVRFVIAGRGVEVGARDIVIVGGPSDHPDFTVFPRDLYSTFLTLIPHTMGDLFFGEDTSAYTRLSLSPESVLDFIRLNQGKAVFTIAERELLQSLPTFSNELKQALRRIQFTGDEHTGDFNARTGATERESYSNIWLGYPLDKGTNNNIYGDGTGASSGDINATDHTETPDSTDWPEHRLYADHRVDITDTIPAHEKVFGLRFGPAGDGRDIASRVFSIGDESILEYGDGGIGVRAASVPHSTTHREIQRAPSQAPQGVSINGGVNIIRLGANAPEGTPIVFSVFTSNPILPTYTLSAVTITDQDVDQTFAQKGLAIGGGATNQLLINIKYVHHSSSVDGRHFEIRITHTGTADHLSYRMQASWTSTVVVPSNEPSELLRIPNLPSTVNNNASTNSIVFTFTRSTNIQGNDVDPDPFMNIVGILNGIGFSVGTRLRQSQLVANHSFGGVHTYIDRLDSIVPRGKTDSILREYYTAYTNEHIGFGRFIQEDIDALVDINAKLRIRNMGGGLFPVSDAFDRNNRLRPEFAPTGSDNALHDVASVVKVLSGPERYTGTRGGLTTDSSGNRLTAAGVVGQVFTLPQGAFNIKVYAENEFGHLNQRPHRQTFNLATIHHVSGGSFPANNQIFAFAESSRQGDTIVWAHRLSDGTLEITNFDPTQTNPNTPDDNTIRMLRCEYQTTERVGVGPKGDTTLLADTYMELTASSGDDYTILDNMQSLVVTVQDGGGGSTVGTFFGSVIIPLVNILDNTIRRWLIDSHNPDAQAGGENRRISVTIERRGNTLTITADGANVTIDKVYAVVRQEVSSTTTPADPVDLAGYLRFGDDLVPSLGQLSTDEFSPSIIPNAEGAKGVYIQHSDSVVTSDGNLSTLLGWFRDGVNNYQLNGRRYTFNSNRNTVYTHGGSRTLVQFRLFY